VNGKRAIYILVATGAVIWCLPLMLCSLAIMYQYSQGTGSLFLIGIGVLPYAAGLIIASLIPIILLRSGRDDRAANLAVVMIFLGIPAAILPILGLGST